MRGARPPGSPWPRRRGATAAGYGARRGLLLIRCAGAGAGDPLGPGSAPASPASVPRALAVGRQPRRQPGPAASRRRGPGLGRHRPLGPFAARDGSGRSLALRPRRRRSATNTSPTRGAAVPGARRRGLSAPRPGRSRRPGCGRPSAWPSGGSSGEGAPARSGLLVLAAGRPAACAPEPPAACGCATSASRLASGEVGSATACLRGHADRRGAHSGAHPGAFPGRVGGGGRGERRHGPVQPAGWRAWPCCGLAAPERERGRGLAGAGGLGGRLLRPGRPEHHHHRPRPAARLPRRDHACWSTNTPTPCRTAGGAGAASGARLPDDLDRLLASKAVTEGEASLVEDLAALGLFGARGAGGRLAAGLRRLAAARPRGGRPDPSCRSTSRWDTFPYPVRDALRSRRLTGREGLPPSIGSTPRRRPRRPRCWPGSAPPEPAGSGWAEELGDDSVPLLPERFSPGRHRPPGRLAARGLRRPRAGLGAAVGRSCAGRARSSPAWARAAGRSREHLSRRADRSHRRPAGACACRRRSQARSARAPPARTRTLGGLVARARRRAPGERRPRGARAGGVRICPSGPSRQPAALRRPASPPSPGVPQGAPRALRADLPNAAVAAIASRSS